MLADKHLFEAKLKALNTSLVSDTSELIDAEIELQRQYDAEVHLNGKRTAMMKLVQALCFSQAGSSSSSSG